MPVFAVHYDYASDSNEPRSQHRPAHRAFLDTLAGSVKALVTGPYVEEPAGALLVVEAASAAEVEHALDDDPFYSEGLITRRSVREWIQIKGPWAGRPLEPARSRRALTDKNPGRRV